MHEYQYIFITLSFLEYNSAFYYFIMKWLLHIVHVDIYIMERRNGKQARNHIMAKCSAEWNKNEPFFTICSQMRVHSQFIVAKIIAIENSHIKLNKAQNVYSYWRGNTSILEKIPIRMYLLKWMKCALKVFFQPH
jgi:hypothetical protein